MIKRFFEFSENKNSDEIDEIYNSIEKSLNRICQIDDFKAKSILLDKIKNLDINDIEIKEIDKKIFGASRFIDTHNVIAEIYFAYFEKDGERFRLKVNYHVKTLLEKLKELIK